MAVPMAHPSITATIIVIFLIFESLKVSMGKFFSEYFFILISAESY
jgi:hypothetical protein